MSYIHLCGTIKVFCLKAVVWNASSRKHAVGRARVNKMYDVAGCDIIHTDIEREQLLIGYYTCISLPNQQNICAEAALSGCLHMLESSVCGKSGKAACILTSTKGKPHNAHEP